MDLVRCQFPTGVGHALPALVAEPLADGPVADPSSAESCFGVIGSVIFRTIISSANVGPINPLKPSHSRSRGTMTLAHTRRFSGASKR